MLVAALDTSTLALSCALCEVEPGSVRVIAERTEHAPAKGARGGPSGGHGGRLPGALSDLLLAEGRTLAEVEGYAIGLGPGSFTGLRIGLATWKGLAYGNARPLAGCSSLAALAIAAAAGAEPGALLVPLLDARKGEVYAGFYRAAPDGRSVEAVAPEEALAPSALAERLVAQAAAGANPALFGGGLFAYPDAFARLPRLAGAASAPSAESVARLCAPALLDRAYDAAAVFALEPHYVRPSEAEVRFPHGQGPGAERGGAH